MRRRNTKKHSFVLYLAASLLIVGGAWKLGILQKGDHGVALYFPSSIDEVQAVSDHTETEELPDEAAVAEDPGTEEEIEAAEVQEAVPETIEETEALEAAEPVEYEADLSYFDDALFIGDSVTQGFGWYADYKDWMRVCAYKGVNPQQILQNLVGRRADGVTQIEMWDDINVQQDVENIYILLGANALLQQSDEAFLKYYGDLLDKLRERFPNVPIYVQSITPTTAAQGAKQPPLENGHIRAVNEAIARMATEKGLYYLNAQEALTDADGNLRADYTGTVDGIHMNPTGYAAWADYLLTHTVYSAYNAQFVTAGPYA